PEMPSAGTKPGSAESPTHVTSDVHAHIAQTVIDHVRAIAKERGKSQLTNETNIVTDLGLDSLERLQIANSLEETFGGRFPEDVLAEIETVGEGTAAIPTYIGNEPRIQRHSEAAAPPWAAGGEIPRECYDFAQMPEYKRLKQMMGALVAGGATNPYFSVHEGLTRDTARIGGRTMISFTTFNYLGM